MPMVEKKYRTRPDRILVGHSLGGLFAAYVLAKCDYRIVISRD